MKIMVILAYMTRTANESFTHTWWG